MIKNVSKLLNSETDNLEGLFCPNCEYPLTGLPENRCPECGKGFKPDLLLFHKATVPHIVHHWKEALNLSHQVRHYLPASFQIMDKPTNFSKGIPLEEVTFPLWCYGLISRAIAVILTILILFGFQVESSSLDLYQLLYIAMQVLVISYLTDFFLSICCSVLCSPLPECPTRGLMDWFMLLQLTSFFLPAAILLASLACLALLIAPWVSVVFGLFILPMGIVWWFATAFVIQARCRVNTGSSIVAIVGIPVSSVSAFIISFFLAAALTA